MSRAQRWAAFLIYSASAGVWGVLYLVHGGAGRLAMLLASVVGVGVCIRLLVRAR